MDCSPENVAAARDYYGSKPGIKPSQIRIVQCLVTPENINDVLRQNDVEGEIDLLSIDIDGNDYWVWKAITVLQPRVVVVEYNASLGVSRSVTVRYDRVFDRYKKHPSGWYHGASLAALTKLAAMKGYMLVGCESHGANAFFVRKDGGHGKLLEVPPEEAYYPLLTRLRVASTGEQFRRIEHLEFEEV